MVADALQSGRSLTRLVLLHELVSHPQLPLRDLARTLNVTAQAVSSQIQELAKAGHVKVEGRRRTVTPQGVQALQEGLIGIKRFVDGALESIALVNTTSAIAKTKIQAGEHVALLMEEGDLVARTGAKSESRGTALHAARPGDEVLVRDLSGVVELAPGKLWIVRVPTPKLPGATSSYVARARTALRSRNVKPARVGAEGTSAKVFVRKLGLPLHFEFAATRATFNATELGMDSALFVSADRAQDTLGLVDTLNQSTLRRVPVVVIDLPGND